MELISAAPIARWNKILTGAGKIGWLGSAPLFRTVQIPVESFTGNFAVLSKLTKI